MSFASLRLLKVVCVCASDTMSSSFTIQDEAEPLMPSGPRKSVDISFLNGQNRQKYLARWQRRNRRAKVKAFFSRIWHFIYNNCFTFLYLHAAYLTGVAFTGAIIIYCIERKRTNIKVCFLSLSLSLIVCTNILWFIG